MPLNVLQVTPYCESAWGYGGIPRVVGALSRGLAERGHAVCVAATDAGYPISSSCHARTLSRAVRHSSRYPARLKPWYAT